MATNKVWIENVSLLLNAICLFPPYARIDLRPFLLRRISFSLFGNGKWLLTSGSPNLHPHCTDKAANSFVQNNPENILRTSGNAHWGQCLWEQCVAADSLEHGGRSSTCNLTDVRLICLHKGHIYLAAWDMRICQMMLLSILEEFATSRHMFVKFING